MPALLPSLLAIAIGAAAGAILRWLLALWLNTLFPAIPPGTLVANLVGGYLIGIALVFFAHYAELSPEWRLLVITGFLGGLTTFSTFSSEVTHLLLQGRLLMATGAIGLHVAGSLLMTLLGMGSAQLLRRWLA
ncbi:fluoride efflux transporter CrcB [Brachymonas wangyanguii]|uniref:fluoride efflux transporter CrcB n=1 Tax=Brachymonas wangyanguii TaxID=3130163 RepID=UPI00307D59AA